jgi:hypothetical protein
MSIWGVGGVGEEYKILNALRVRLGVCPGQLLNTLEVS